MRKNAKGKMRVGGGVDRKWGNWSIRRQRSQKFEPKI